MVSASCVSVDWPRAPPPSKWLNAFKMAIGDTCTETETNHGTHHGAHAHGIRWLGAPTIRSDVVCIEPNVVCPSLWSLFCGALFLLVHSSLNTLVLQVVRGELRTHARRIPVAVKLLPGLTDDAVRTRFDKELKAHITAQHVSSGVCRLVGTCEKDGTLYLVMKLYNGNLRDRITAGLDVGEARRVAHALSRTLEQLHAAGVIVKDIKPENVLMDEFGQPVLADFGISEVVTRTTRIMPTSVQGTFSYMAPELFESEGHGPEVDVWSLACVVVEMCTGVMPFAGMQMAQIMRAVCDRHVVPDVPDHAPAAAVIRRCFAFEPAGRPTVAELAAALAPEAVELPEVVDGLTDAFARKVATLTAERDRAVAAQVAADQERDRVAAERTTAVAQIAAERDAIAAERDRAVAAQAAADAERTTAVARIAAERDRAVAAQAAADAEIQRLRTQMAAGANAGDAASASAAAAPPRQQQRVAKRRRESQAVSWWSWAGSLK
jgi:hypothetical protein